MSPATAHRATTGPLAELLARTPAPAPHPHAEALHAEIAHWLTGTGLLDAPATAHFLDRGHLDLAARCWGDVPAGPGLRAATKWLVLTRILDERVDGRDETARRTLAALQSLTATGHVVPAARTEPDGAELPLVRAFEELRRDGATLAGPDWQARSAADFRAHLDSSLDQWEASGSAPTVPQYLTHGGRDGATRCAAGWGELAHGLDLPDHLHRHPQLTDLLTRFRHLVRWIGDLGSTDPATGQNLLRALEVHRGLPSHLAATRVAELCAAELTTLEFLADGIARGSHWPTQVRRHAQGLVRHVHALIHWTAGAPAQQR
ncbi:terpene synthase family protein [Kitasatospora sp. NPDC092948]|uniref:terpene synthase family protein n=1 Tax=Kitasatospora sp. NPDC092948 TaxID=3364088 RepID=UPI00381430C1